MRTPFQENVGGALRPDISRPIFFRVHSFALAVGAPLDGARACANQRAISVSRPQRGSLILVVLCLLAVLGIALASFLAIGNQSMKLSNRSYRTSVSAQLAEMGIEEALRAFNTNNWADWTTSGTSADWTTSGTTATCTITFPTAKFGQGVTGTVKIRVDNYNANHLGSTWSSSRNYRIGDQVGYNGVWYSCVQNHSNQTPSGFDSLAYWVPEPFPWKWRPNSDYTDEEVVNHDHDNDGIGTWFRCTADHTSSTTWDGTNWATIGAIASYSSSYWSHNIGDIFYYPNSNTWYRWTATSASYTTTPEISWKYESSKVYKFNDLVCYGSTYIWYRFVNGTPTSGITPGSNTAYWEIALSGTNSTSASGAHGWSSSSINYNLGDVVYYSSTNQWYRCILTHTSSASLTPANTSYWTNTPLLSQQWKPGPYYSTNDLVTYNGVWYRCISSHTSSVSILPTNTSYWIGADTSDTSYTWNATSNYSAGAYRCYGGVWYKCLSAGSNKTPNNSSYWTASWAQSSGVTTGATVVYAEGTAILPDGSAAINTQLRAPIAPAPLFPNAAGSTTTLTISSGTGTVNSYDSITDPTASNPGHSAVLAAGTTLAINGTTAVSGYIAWPSPPSGISTDTTIWGPSSPASPKVDTTRVSRSPFIPQLNPLPATSLASAFSSANFPRGRNLPTSGTPSTDTTLNLGTPGATTPSKYYYNSTLNIGTGYYIKTLNINGPVKLYINGNLYLRSGGTLQVNARGSVEIHVDGAIRTFSGAPGFVNQTKNPRDLFLISDVSSTTAQQFVAPTPSTNDFYGIIYAPYTTATLGLDIKTGVNIYGAISAREVTFSSEATLHYDTSLRYATFTGVDQPWAVTEWRELTDPAERAVLP